MTLAEAVAAGARRIEAAGVPADEARRDAAVLARWVLHWDEARWLGDRHNAASAGFHAAFSKAIDRRASREPIAYLTGEREFYGRVFTLTPDVLIPRPETELVIEEALVCLLARQDGASSRTHPLILDVGTGSGCLAVTLAVEWPDARVIATDQSAAALDVARANARRLGVADRIEFRPGDLLAGVEGPVDVLVSNPPYVTEADRASLSPEVGVHEPAGALFGGPDGLDVIRALVPEAAQVLAPGGSLVVEIGWGQARAVAQLIQDTPGLTLLRIRPDLQQIPRVVVARREETRNLQ